MSLKNIKAILIRATSISPLKSLKVGGWVKSIRQNKFIELNDGSCLDNLQLICPSSFKKQLKEIRFGSYLLVKGQLVLTPHQAQSCELKLEKITTVRAPDLDYPLQKKKISLETVRHFPHLRAKTNYFLTLFRLRHSLSKAIHDFFHHEGFYYVPTPIITSNDAEGAGATFNLTTCDKKPFFSKPAKLTVSGQLHAEALAQGLGQVYTFAPCFRAEKSHTTRHLAEFWMVETELAPISSLETLLKLVISLVKFVIQEALTNCLAELKYLEKYHEQEIISKLVAITEQDFLRLDYTQAINILKKSKEKFAFNSVKWGMDLKSEHEKFLCRYFGDQPIFITSYPRTLKAFYMKNRSDKKTVNGFDLIFPSVGELVGGGMRESNYQTLYQKAKKHGIDPQELAWYFDLRRLGYAPSGGFGLGLERLIMLISGAENIQDTTAFPHFHQHLNF